MAVPATEDFTGSAGVLDPNKWVQQCTQTVNYNGSGLGTVSGADAANGSAAYWGADQFSPNQYSKVEFRSGVASSAYCGVSVRANDVTVGTRDLYGLVVSGDSGATAQTRMSVVVNGSVTTLADYAQAWSSGDIIEIRANGTSIQAFRNGASLGTAITDSTLTQGYPGLAPAEAVATAPTFDNWEGGNLSPYIANHPTNVTAPENTTASFSISAVSSSGTLSYQWKDDGSNVGTDSSTYSPVVALADSGSLITCVVTDSNGSVTSNAALLTVTPAGKLSFTKA